MALLARSARRSQRVLHELRRKSCFVSPSSRTCQRAFSSPAATEDATTDAQVTPESHHDNITIRRRMNSIQPVHSVAVTWQGNDRSVSPIWLRDACECSDCVDPSTRQKSFATTDIPPSIQAQTSTQSDDSLTIQWKNDIRGSSEGHSTTLSSSRLSSMFNQFKDLKELRNTTRRTWERQDFEQQCIDIPYEEYMEDDRTVLRALAQLDAFGLLFLKDVPDDEAAINGIVERIGPLKNTFYGLTWDVRSVPQAKNVAYTSGDLDFHMDLMYMDKPPELQFLHCIRSSAKGGASRFTDLYSALDKLLAEDLAAFQALCSTPVSYRYRNDSQDYFRSRNVVTLPWHQHFKTNTNGALHTLLQRNTTLAWSPPFQGPFQILKDRSLEEMSFRINRWHRAAKKLRSIFERPSRVYERLMRSGQCVIFDNRRVLHARTAFEVDDAGKERFLKGAYLDSDVLSSRRRVLKARYPELSSAAAAAFAKPEPTD